MALATKIVKRGASQIAKTMTTGFTPYAAIGGGMMAAYGGTKWLANPGAHSSIKVEPGENPYSVKNFKESGYVERLSILGAMGLAGPGGGVTKSLGLVGAYHTERFKDIWGSTVGNEGGPLSSAFKSGAAIGGSLGAGTGLMASLMSWGRVPLLKAVPILGVMGAVAGGYGARKVNLDVARAVNQAKKNSLNRRKITNRARGGGQGFRAWASGPRAMGKPGHLGMNGSVPFSMHKARHRSTV